MKRLKYAIILCLAPSPLHAGLVPLGEHVDIRSHFVAGAWNNVLRVDSRPAPHDPAEAFLPLSDKPYISSNPTISGSRQTQPSSSSFAFTGAQPGDPIWTAIQGTPGIGEAWPGFDNDQPFGTFGSYIPADLRVSQENPRPWLKITLAGYQPPPGKASHFSMWNSTSGKPPTVWMSTFDANIENAYYFAEGSHTHVWWGFTAQGIHKITLQSSAFLGPGATNPTGPGDPFTVVFAVGTMARWQAVWFDAAELDDPAVSGLFADADGDGLSNFIEYAFGTHPRSGASVPLADGLGLPLFSLSEESGTVYQTLTYPRRRAGERTAPELYQPLFADSPAGPWTDAGVTSTAVDFPPSQTTLNADWELVTSRRPVPSGSSSGFGRVAVTPGDGFAVQP
ncbi:MAG: choice-of-anchor M domain-containing protein [Luteolibacter sp.]|jgi:hypothetical protein|nr:choice-of-anchor M domain-containing protein [Luteolibacter sp.]